MGDLLDAADRERQYAERARRDAERDGFPIPPAENESDKDYTRAKNEATLSDDERLKIALWKA